MYWFRTVTLNRVLSLENLVQPAVHSSISHAYHATPFIGLENQSDQYQARHTSVLCQHP
jgi:hypothetical protein